MKNYIITGGNFANKGAQAMTLAMIQELLDYNPNCKIWVLSFEQLRATGPFESLFFNRYLLLRLLIGKFKFMVPRKDPVYEAKVDQVLKSADMAFDLSGFALSSQFGFRPSLSYILRIALMKKYNCPLILLPQSFGPFDYSFLSKLILFPLFNKYLKYPTKIYARESQGYNDLKKFTLENLDSSVDLVLRTRNPQPELFLLEKCADEIRIKANSVGIIPNSKLLKWNKHNDIVNIYFVLAKILSEHGFHIYVLRHSKEDLSFCQKLYDRLKVLPDVNILDNDYNCIELLDIISRMTITIASRYHSLIHSYKSGVPTLVFGWSTKYREVMRYFNQEQYFFDIRNQLKLEEIIRALQLLLGSITAEKQLLEKNTIEPVSDIANG